MRTHGYRTMITEYKYIYIYIYTYTYANTYIGMPSEEVEHG
jgi:hypothetical protein